MPEYSQGPVLAVDLGGTKIIAAVVLRDGRIISRHHCLTLADEGPDAVINRLLSAIGRTAAKAKLKTSDLGGVVIAAAGILSAEEGVVTTSPNLPHWCDVPLGDILTHELGTVTYLINDASAAALGEHRFGAGKEVRNLIYLTVSTGIGGGIIIDGRLYSGTDGCAAELGHMTIDSHGPQCNCGNFGCLEVLASGTAMAKDASGRIGRGERSSIAGLVEGRLEIITAETVALAARQGDPLAIDVVTKAANYLGIGLANLVNIFNPELILVGGGVSKMGDMLLRPARKVVRERAFQLPARTVRIVRARLGGDAGIMGAAVHTFEREPGRNLET